MTTQERDEYLGRQRTCRVATISPAGPHVTPLWFYWDGTSLWLTSLHGTQRWIDLERDPRVAIVIDDGDSYLELRGVEIQGSVEVVGEAPRTGLPHGALEPIEDGYARKYQGGGEMRHDGRHAWLCVTPSKISSWDFAKIGPS